MQTFQDIWDLQINGPYWYIWYGVGGFVLLFIANEAIKMSKRKR